jgi:hypothetical protein
MSKITSKRTITQSECRTLKSQRCDIHISWEVVKNDDDRSNEVVTALFFIINMESGSSIDLTMPAEEARGLRDMLNMYLENVILEE